MNYESHKMVPLKQLRPTLLVRKMPGFMDKVEFEQCSRHFSTTVQRTEVRPGSLVIPRFSGLPFYRELCVDLRNQRARCINNSLQHDYVAHLGEWYQDLRGMTPETWTRLEDVPDGAFPIVIKGETNSRKDDWDGLMFAPNRSRAVEIMLRLQSDGEMGRQPLYFRRYEPLKTYMKGLGGIPVTEEYRFFVAYGQVFAGGFYWQNYVDDLPEVPKADVVPKDFLLRVIDRVGKNINFFVIDVARHEDGSWVVVELNDGGQSGLTTIDPAKFYANLADVACQEQYDGR